MRYISEPVYHSLPNTPKEEKEVIKWASDLTDWINRLVTPYNDLAIGLQDFQRIARFSSIFVYECPANITELNIYPIDGNTDLEYILISRVKSNTTGYIYLYPNGITGAGDKDSISITSAIAASNVTTVNGVNMFGHVGFLNAAKVPPGYNYSISHIFAKTGMPRMMIQEVSDNYQAGDGDIRNLHISSWWRDTTKNITSLLIQAQNPNGIGASSIFELYARRA